MTFCFSFAEIFFKWYYYKCGLYLLNGIIIDVAHILLHGIIIAVVNILSHGIIICYAT